MNPSPMSPDIKSKFNSLIIMVSVATVLGFLAAIGIWQYLSQTQKQVKELTVTRAVIVASKQIPVGTKITDEFIATKQFPANAIPKDYPDSVDNVLGKITRTTLEKDEIITTPRLVTEGAEGGLPMVIPKGYRAITIKVNEVSGVAGLIAPGDRVDILSVLNKSEEQTLSKTILQNIQILAVGDKIIDPNNITSLKPSVTSQITVALKPNDAEKLALASQAGEIHLILRPLGENTISQTDGSNLQDVYGYFTVDSNIPSDLSITTSKAQIKNSIEVILGNKRTYQYF